MCGRFANQIDNFGVWGEILVDWPFASETGYNVAPSRNIPVLTYDRQANAPAGQEMRWGLVPSWSKEINPEFSTFNARIETLSKKPAYRTAWRQSRTCLIPVRGYYEWKNETDGKQPYFIHLVNEEPMMLAGVWDVWSKNSKPLYSCSIITRPAMGDLIKIHPRMPLRVNFNRALNWLQKGEDWLHIISHQQHPDEYAAYRVSKQVNRPANNGPHLIEADRNTGSN